MKCSPVTWCGCPVWCSCGGSWRWRVEATISMWEYHGSISWGWLLAGMIIHIYMGYNEFIGTFENAIELVDKLFLSNQSYSFVVMMSKLFKIWSTARVSAGTAYFYIFLYTYIHNLWLFVWNMNFMTYSIQLGISSSQLTNSIIFQRGRYTTNQNISIMDPVGISI